MILVVSTLPHFLTLLYSPDVYYSGVVTLSTLASIIWHYEGSDLTPICVIDHLLAALWFFTDLQYSYNTHHFITIINLNIYIFILNCIVSPYNYTYTHSLWHLLSAVKSIYVSSLHLENGKVFRPLAEARRGW